MSYNDFDYNRTLDSIKANLFDIYESQERIIGSLEDENVRQVQISNYVKMKDTAITLIEEIENLYQNKKHKLSKNENDNNKENSEVEEDKELKIVEVSNTTVEEPTIEENSIPEEPIVDEQETTNEINQKEVTESEDEKQESVEVEEETTDLKEQEDDSNENNAIEKFYLDDRNGTRPNFAYVPQNLLEVIKQNGITSLNKEPKVDDKKIKKIDEDKARGIIVRNDQFMKLALSRHRQESVLEDARKYRVAQAKASSRKLVEEEEKNLDAKVKTLKVA